MIPKAVVITNIWDLLEKKYPDKLDNPQQVFDSLPEIYQDLVDKKFLPPECTLDIFIHQAQQGFIKAQLMGTFQRFSF